MCALKKLQREAVGVARILAGVLRALAAWSPHRGGSAERQGLGAAGTVRPGQIGAGDRIPPKWLKTGLPIASPEGKMGVFLDPRRNMDSLGLSLKPTPQSTSWMLDRRGHNFVLECWGPSFVSQLCRDSLPPQRTRPERLDPKRACGRLWVPNLFLRGAHC